MVVSPAAAEQARAIKQALRNHRPKGGGRVADEYLVAVFQKLGLSSRQLLVEYRASRNGWLAAGIESDDFIDWIFETGAGAPGQLQRQVESIARQVASTEGGAHPRGPRAEGVVDDPGGSSVAKTLKGLDEEEASQLRQQKAFLLEEQRRDGPAGLGKHLDACCKQRGVVEAAGKQQDPQPLRKTRVFLIHHLTREVLATIEALRRLGATHITAQFCGYNKDAAKLYGPQLDTLPSEELRACKMSLTSEGEYLIDETLLKWVGSEFPSQALNEGFKGCGYLHCARALGSWLTLKMLAECKTIGEQLLVVEDGGYVAPLFNRGALTGDTVASFRAQHGIPVDPETDSILDPLLADALAPLVGTVEHTRNGYDKVQAVALEFGRLVKPMFTIAVSYVKTQVESWSVSTTCLNAIENAMMCCGAVLRARNVCVLGSRGNIGGCGVDMLCNRLEDPEEQLIGIDIKVGLDDDSTTRPVWLPSPYRQRTTAKRSGVREYRSFQDIPKEVRRGVDLIFGITGGRSQAAGGDSWEETLTVADVEFWLCEGASRQLWLASGSTKTKEFEVVMRWADEGAARGNVPCRGGAWLVWTEDLRDPLSNRDYGAVYTFRQGPAEKRLLVVCDWKPVNFLFYGVPTEDIDVILAQLLDVTLALRRNPGAPPEVHAVDYSPLATNGIVGSRGMLQDPLPLPLPGWMPAARAHRANLPVKPLPGTTGLLEGATPGERSRQRLYVRGLGMQPLSSEGGYFVETYRSEHAVGCPDRQGGMRSALTVIYYMISADMGGMNFLHYNKSDIVHFFIDGWPAEYTLVSPEGEVYVNVLGRDVARGQVPQLLCPSGWLKTARPAPGFDLSEEYHSEPFSLLCESVSPGFDFRDRHVPGPSEVRASFPALWERLAPFVSPDAEEHESVPAAKRTAEEAMAERVAGQLKGESSLEFIIHLARAAKWEHSLALGGGRYTPEEGETFVHAAPDMECMLVIANAFYRNVRAPFVLLKIALSKVTAPVVFEDPAIPTWLGLDPEEIDKLGWWQTLKHVGVPYICGDLNCDAVADVLPAPRGPDGDFREPPAAA